MVPTTDVSLLFSSFCLARPKSASGRGKTRVKLFIWRDVLWGNLTAHSLMVTLSFSPSMMLFGVRSRWTILFSLCRYLNARDIWRNMEKLCSFIAKSALGESKSCGSSMCVSFAEWKLLPFILAIIKNNQKTVWQPGFLFLWVLNEYVSLGFCFGV